MVSRTIVLMGVSGCGKTTVGRALAERAGAVFVDADDLHPVENVKRMAAGVALDDEARGPWLDAVADEIARHRAAEHDLVIACSALKRAYRDRLREVGPLRFVLLDVPEAVLRERLDDRTGHFMSASLLRDQLATLERPGPDEPDTLVVDGTSPLTSLVPAIIAALTVL
jgi:gluconokinase